MSVEKAGNVLSPPIRAHSAGIGYWVETLVTKHPDSGETVELHRGACGLENERTIVHDETEPALATTGGGVVPILTVGAALALGGSLLALVVGVRQQRRVSA